MFKTVLKKFIRWFFIAFLVAFIIGFVGSCTMSMAGAATSSKSGYDGDTRHCVTAREIWIVGDYKTQAQIEKRWEMTGRGRYVEIPIPDYGYAWVYDMCDGDQRLAVMNVDKNKAVVGTLKITSSTARFQLVA